MVNERSTSQHALNHENGRTNNNNNALRVMDVWEMAPRILGLNAFNPPYIFTSKWAFAFFSNL
jgi:hypothetical protein